ncbi:c-type cytochrome [Maricaulis sp. CAU 1757]
MGDLFWNKVAGVVIGAVLAVMAIMEFGHLVVPSHGAYELTAENTSYPVDWDLIASGPAAEVEVDTGPVDYGLLLASADLGNGERAARRCAACHSFDEGGPNGVGPNLWNVVGSDIASGAGFAYSAALQGIEGNWTFEALDGFIENPSGWAPGTNMSFRGLGDQAMRIDLIAYLRSLSDNPVDLPEPLPAAPEGELGEDGPELDEADPAEVEDMAPMPASDDAQPEDGTVVDASTGEPVSTETASDTIENPEAEELAEEVVEDTDEDADR